MPWTYFTPLSWKNLNVKRKKPNLLSYNRVLSDILCQRQRQRERHICIIFSLSFEDRPIDSKIPSVGKKRGLLRSFSKKNIDLSSKLSEKNNTNLAFTLTLTLAQDIRKLSSNGGKTPERNRLCQKYTIFSNAILVGFFGIEVWLLVLVCLHLCLKMH